LQSLTFGRQADHEWIFEALELATILTLVILLYIAMLTLSIL